VLLIDKMKNIEVLTSNATHGLDYTEDELLKAVKGNPDNINKHKIEKDDDTSKIFVIKADFELKADNMIDVFNKLSTHFEKLCRQEESKLVEKGDMSISMKDYKSE